MAIILPLNNKNIKNEKGFKRYLMNNLKNTKNFLALFEIETEETVLGFPDVLAITKENRAVLYEFKYSNKQGVIKFQPTQPAFYKANKELDIRVIALSEYRGEFYIHGFKVQELFREGSMYKMDGMNQVDLNPMRELLVGGGEVQ